MDYYSHKKRIEKTDAFDVMKAFYKTTIFFMGLRSVGGFKNVLTKTST